MAFDVLSLSNTGLGSIGPTSAGLGGGLVVVLLVPLVCLTGDVCTNQAIAGMVCTNAAMAGNVTTNAALTGDVCTNDSINGNVCTNATLTGKVDKACT